MSIPVPMTSVEWPGEPVAAVTCLPEPLSPTMTRDRTVPSDSELLEQLSREQIGSTTVQAALTQILERHGGLVYAVARRTVSDRPA